MRASFLALAIVALALPAVAEPLQLFGKFGYLGEYQLTANIPKHVLSERTAYSGPMLVKHVGMCSHNGPDEAEGKIDLRFAKANSRVKAILVFDGRKCSFSGELSETAPGALHCSDATVPFTLWLR